MEELSKGMDKFVAARDFLGVLSRMQLSPLARKMFFFLVSRINGLKDEKFEWYELEVSKINETFKTNYKNVYDELDDALADLGTTILYHNPEKKRRLRASMVRSDYYYGEGRVELILEERFQPFLLGINDLLGYIHGSIDFCLNQKQSIVVTGYFLLKSKRVYGKPEITANNWQVTLEDFCEILNIPKSSRRTDHLKRRILNPIQKAMNEDPDCDIHVSWEYERHHRKIKWINFNLRSKDINERSPMLFTKENIKRKEAYQVTGTKKWLMEELSYTEDDYKALVDFVNTMTKVGTFKAFEEYLSGFPWWRDVESSEISLKTFRIHVLAFSANFLAAEDLVRNLVEAELDGKAKQGAVINKLREAIKRKGENVGRQLLSNELDLL